MQSRKPSPTTVIACLALFVALGGTAIAASRYVITSTSQIAPSVRSALATPTSYLLVTSPQVSIRPGAYIGTALAKCPQTDHVVTGGYTVELGTGAYVMKDEPIGAKGWDVFVDNHASTEVSTVRARALCAPGSIVTVGKTY